MVKMKIDKTFNGAPEGHSVQTFEKGKEYDVPADFAALVIGDGSAHKVVVDAEADAKSDAKAKAEADAKKAKDK